MRASDDIWAPYTRRRLRLLIGRLPPRSRRFGRRGMRGRSEMNPYVTLVVACQNAGYGGNFAGRMQNFLDVLFELGVERGADLELVVVEWNTPAGRPGLASVLRWPERLPFPVRFFEVPPEEHQRFPNADVMPIFEFIAKNVGIR